MKNIAIKVDKVTKEYKKGVINYNTLREELQSFWEQKKQKKSCDLEITSNEQTTFKAIDDIYFEINTGESVGIIGYNGAGKSTLLKLISKLAVPTKGSIYIDGVVTSMLEVGTGFHPELTGRENIYLNGAILGMTKKEIDKKFIDIVNFSEIAEFIDTPVKRYSSGMHLKLAFSVAANLNADIIIIDEILSIGDVAFQNKCLKRMKEMNEKEGKTILCVSHNMDIIKDLCKKCLVLKEGKVVFYGNTKKAIKIYLNEGF